jgi:hypothetical protein
LHSTSFSTSFLSFSLNTHRILIVPILCDNELGTWQADLVLQKDQVSFV